jgi:hypothetical protein
MMPRHDPFYAVCTWYTLSTYENQQQDWIDPCCAFSFLLLVVVVAIAAPGPEDESMVNGLSHIASVIS